MVILYVIVGIILFMSITFIMLLIAKPVKAKLVKEEVMKYNETNNTNYISNEYGHSGLDAVKHCNAGKKIELVMKDVSEILKDKDFNAIDFIDKFNKED